MIPQLQALVIAEKIYEDKSGKKIIAGTFDTVHLVRRKVPAEVADEAGRKRVPLPPEGSLTPWAYVNLTDVCDKTKLKLQFVSLSRNVVIFETALMVQSTNRLASVEIVLPLPDLGKVFDRFKLTSGVYAFDVVCEGEILGSHRITVRVDDWREREVEEEQA